MDNSRLFEKARQLIAKPKPQTIVNTESLQDYIGCSIVTPLGNGIIESVVLSHYRRVNNKTYTLYKLWIDHTTIKSITAYAHTQWLIT